MKCIRCKKVAEIELKSHNAAFCRECFLVFFYNQVSRAIKSFSMFSEEDRILVAVSGGKDSMSLWDALVELGYNVTGLFIDLGIGGFSELAKDKVIRFAKDNGLDLRIVSLVDEGIPIPKIVRKIRKPPCSICGQVKRYYFNMEGLRSNFDVLVTGHNLDDEVSRLFGNILHWKVEYLVDQAPVLPAGKGLLRKAKPLFRLSEYETAAYAFFRGIDYLDKSCPFSKGATFNRYKKYLNAIEYESPATKIDFYQGFLRKMGSVLDKTKSDAKNYCRICGYPSYKDVCMVCRLKGFA